MRNPFYFVSAEARAAFAVLFAVYWISETMIARRMRAGQQDHTDDRGSLALLGLVLTVAWWASVALAWIPVGSFASPTVFLAGLLVMATGQLLRWWSVATLGRLFTVNVAIRTDHHLVESGPYRYVRHPAYTAILLFHLGAGLCLGNVLSLTALVVPLAAALLRRIRVEEEVLMSGLGQSYREYARRTKRLVPGLY
jgi:protein-S-isoprenylcysteine O-methyltransferase